MATSVTSSRRDVEQVVRKLIEIAEDVETKAADVEKRLWSGGLELGRALMGLFFAGVAKHHAPGGAYEHEGRSFATSRGRFATRTTPIGTLFGKVEFARPVGLAVDRGAADLPVDRAVGLTGGFTHGVTMAIGQLAAQMSFGATRETFATFTEWTPSSRTVLRMVDALGEHARTFLEKAKVPDDDGEILVIEVDGGGAPMVHPCELARRRARRRPRKGRSRRHDRRDRRRAVPRKRRQPGDKAKNAKVAVVGAIYTLRRTPDGLEGPINKRLIATFESHEALFKWLRAEADKRGYGRKTTLFLADGANIIWDLRERYFKNTIPCLDWYHTIEKLWEVAGDASSSNDGARAAWIAAQKKRLRRGQLEDLLDDLNDLWNRTPKTGPGNKAKRERLQSILGHLGKHRQDLRYHLLRRQDFPIGTGVIEGAVRNLVRMRLDGPGMRWSRGRAERLLHLRCILLNRQWRDFADFLRRDDRVVLLARPIPTQPHAAKLKTAA
jgi:hypothetical protein